MELSGKVLVAVGWQDICSQFHRCHPEALKNCIESDTALTVGVNFGEFKDYRCKNNLGTWSRRCTWAGGILTIETSGRFNESPFGEGISGPEPGDYAVLTVSDTGIGIDKGTGLGLAIVYGVVQQHNGLVHVYSEPGKGTSFRIYLPLFQPETESSSAGPAGDQPPLGGSETILLGEDDPDVRQFMRTVLVQFGYTVVEATDGQAVVDQFQAHPDVDLILMDLIMPKKNGRQAYEAISAPQPGVRVL